MDTRVLSVLMWKHGVVRLRRFILTTVECLSPVIFFILLFVFKDNIKPVLDSRLATDIVGNTELLPLLKRATEPLMIMYHPDTNFTTLLMNEVGQQLRIPRLKYYPSRMSKGYLPYTNESQLTSFVSTMKRMDAVIIFEKMDGDTWPAKLNYTIRMKGDFSTDGYKPTDSTPGPHRGFGLNYETFMRIQWAVDMSYVKLRTGEEINQTIFLREFPYYNTLKFDEMQLICLFLEIMCWISLLLPFVFLTGRLIDERTSGIQELMKMVGVTINALGLSHFLNALPAGLIFSTVGTILLKASSNPLIPNSNGLLIFLMLLLYYNSVVALAFACSYITKTNQYATTLSVIAHIVCWIPAMTFAKYNVPYVVTLLTGFLPHAPMYWFWKEVSILEVYDRGVNFSTMMSANYENNCSVFLTYVFLLIQAFLFYLLAWYLSLVRPGKYGTALPWNFPFKMLNKRKQEKLSVESDTCDDVALHPMKKYWNKNEVIPKPAIDEEVFETNDGQYFEPPPNNMEVGIKFENVSKVYPKQVALKNVSLEVYKGEITVLLGHNGAGKTTLMSIITGMTSATGGSVLVHGADTVSQRAEVRRHLGLCPQHNLFFSDLTVHEHVMFFTLLKKSTFAEARQTSKKLIDQLGISDKLSSLVSQLSGGMKRRVQLACALAGDADVLILDEPTSGLDVETRRGLWDLLLSLRGERTVLLTTHFMEEADALGDRVAALHLGTLRCFATTMHLKKAVGTGYRLTFTTIGVPKESSISTVVTSHVSDAIVKETTINTISYNLPSHASDKFPQLFADLEANRSRLGIDSIGVGVSTLEEVFLKLCSDVDTSINDDEVDSAPTSDPTTERVTGVLLYLRQVKVLIKRQIKYAYSRKLTFLILQILIPLLMIFIFTKQSNAEKFTFPDSMLLNLDVYADQSDRRVLYNVNMSDVSMKIYKDQYPDVTFQETTDVADKVLRIGMDDILEYNKYLVGVELNEENATALYTTTVRHAAPVALNMLSNLFASRYIPSADARTITTYNQPFQLNYQLERFKEQPKLFISAIAWAIFIVFIILSTNINSISLPCKERETGSRHIHIMSGCPSELYWGTTLLFHTLLCVVSLILPTGLAALLLDQDKTIDQPAFIGAFTLIMIVGTMAFFAFMYLLSFYFSEHTTNTLLVACLVVFGIITPSIKTTQELFQTEPSKLSNILAIFEYTIPAHTLVTAAVKCVNVARLNTWCILSDFCKVEVPNEPAFDSKKCCAGIDHCYFCSDDYSPAYGIFIMIAQFLIYMTMVTLTQRGMFNGLTDTVMNMRYSSSEPDSPDDMVRAEKTYVNKAIDLPPKQISDSMLVDDVHKTYVPFFRRKVNAVKGVSFSVKQGECFGLLGVNGAGKSTIFKMLTAEECPTKGRIFGNGYFLKRGNSEYLQTLGYCPQFFGLDMFQTGEDNLAMILTLRGLDEGWVKKEVKSWLDIIGLGKYASRVVSGYSGGCARRLGAAAALCGGAACVLLDEPTSGVDVTARRRLWAAIRRAQAQHRAVLITSHSMDEMEALCSRIAIMSGGSVRALGAAATLRAAHAQGHAVVFKVQHVAAEDEVDSSKSKMSLLKSKLHENFDCTLKDEHQTMLHYHINETMRYSDLFSQLEALKKQFPNLIEDYSVTETTLEEVFLSFAKEQHENV